MMFVHDDGGRREAGFRGETGDCVTRAIAIATELPYADVYATLKAAMGPGKSPRDGVPRRLYDPYLAALGWTWTPTMHVGSGCTVHLRPEELPAGRLIARLSRHMCAVVDGIVHDLYDPSRRGTRCVYGYWQAGATEGT